MKPSERLAELKLALPKVAAPVGSYVPAVRTGYHVYTSGQIPMRDGKLAFTGKVPDDVSIDAAAEAALVAVMNALAAVSEAAGGIDNIARVVKVNVFVNSSRGFIQQPQVANGASDLLFEVFGEAGRHARAAVGVAELPLDAAVEVDLRVEVVQ
jgi:enamine deaminase RidA (YjgF/YER057c/UK114 family)